MKTKTMLNDRILLPRSLIYYCLVADCRLPTADSFKIRTIIIKIIQSPSYDRLSKPNQNWLSKTIQLIYLQCAVRHSFKLLNCFVKVRLRLDNSLKQTCLFNYTYFYFFSIVQTLVVRYLLEWKKRRPKRSSSIFTNWKMHGQLNMLWQHSVTVSWTCDA